MAVSGELKRNYSPEALRVALENGILWDKSRGAKDGEPRKFGPFRRWKSNEKKLSLNILLHNDKLMMGLSLVIAIVVWALVVNGPANVKTKTIRKDAAIDLTDTYAENNNIRVIETPRSGGGNHGQRAPVGHRLPRRRGYHRQGETYLIQTAGPAVLNISVSKTNKNADFEITGYTPLHRYSTVRLLGYRGSAGAYGYIPSVQVEDPDTQQLGEPMLDRTYFQNSMVKLEGPRATVSRITSIVARVEADKPIGTVQVYAARLVALDADGNEVDSQGLPDAQPLDGENRSSPRRSMSRCRSTSTGRSILPITFSMSRPRLPPIRTL